MNTKMSAKVNIKRNTKIMKLTVAQYLNIKLVS